MLMCNRLYRFLSSDFTLVAKTKCSFFFLDCGDVVPVTDGSVSYSSGTTYQSEATFSCDTGYTLSEAITRICRADKTWSNANPTCIINGI